MRDLVDVNGGPKIIHFTLCLFSLLSSAHELWREEGTTVHTDRRVGDGVCVSVCALLDPS